MLLFACGLLLGRYAPTVISALMTSFDAPALPLSYLSMDELLERMTPSPPARRRGAHKRQDR